MKKTIQEWTQALHGTARDKGWWDEPKSPLEVHMLVVSEVAEATEAARVDGEAIHFLENGKPEGEAIELADAVIRIMDYFGYKGWDLEEAIRVKHEYNQTRSHRHGGKKY